MKSKRRMPAERSFGAEASGSSQKEFLRVQESVWRMVQAAYESGSSLVVVNAATEIGKAHPNAGLSDRDIADALVFAAVDHGVAIERTVPRVRHLKLPRLSLGALRQAANSAGMQA